jgi:hypothetical protein
VIGQGILQDAARPDHRTCCRSRQDARTVTIRGVYSLNPIFFARYTAGCDDPIRSEKPVLILSGNPDPVTPPLWGEPAEKILSNRTHVTMDGIAHGPFPSCAIDMMARFVNAGTLRDLDTSGCDKLRRPGFVLPSSLHSATYETKDPIEQEIFDVERQLIEAVSQGDRSKLNGSLPDDFQQRGLTDWGCRTGRTRRCGLTGRFELQRR